MLRTVWPAACAMALAACTTTSNTSAPLTVADAKRLVLSNKTRIYKDPDSVRDASIQAPSEMLGRIYVCVEANARNSFGGYTGLRTLVVMFSTAQEYMNAYSEDTWIYGCSSSKMVAFPELSGALASATKQQPSPRS